jgi:hypothetical protein
MTDKINQDFYKIKYAQILNSADEKQISSHLDDVNKSGDLIYLITAVINFWMDHADSKENAQNAELALNKLAIILDNIDVKVINEILNNLHEHEIKDQLTNFLVKDLQQLIKIFHKKNQAATIIKFTFLLNFLDHETSLEVMQKLSGTDIIKILNNQKANLLFARNMQHILKYSDIYHDLFLDNNLITTLASQLDKNLEFRLDDNTQKIFKNIEFPIKEINHLTALKSYSILEMIDHHQESHPNLQDFAKEHLLPILKDHQIGKEILANNKDIKEITFADIPKNLIKKYENATFSELMENITTANQANTANNIAKAKDNTQQNQNNSKGR